MIAAGLSLVGQALPLIGGLANAGASMLGSVNHSNRIASGNPMAFVSALAQTVMQSATGSLSNPASAAGRLGMVF